MAKLSIIILVIEYIIIINQLRFTVHRHRLDKCPCYHNRNERAYLLHIHAEFNEFPKQNKLQARLKSVIGRNAVNVNACALHHTTDTLLQVAGSSIIVSSTATLDKLEGHLISRNKQIFTCVAITTCGRFAATGESGHNPNVRIWQLRDDQGNFVGKLVRSMPAHTVSIIIVKFTPDDSTLISIGCQHDAQIITWNWRTGQDMGVGKLTSPVNAITVSYDSSMCVTVGCKSVKYWFLPMASDGVNKRSGLTSRSAILADKRNVTFVDATFCDSSNRLVTVTLSGEILEFNGNKKYVKCYSWKDTFKAVCVARIPEGLLVGCSDGLIRLFCLIGDDLDFLADLAPPIHLFLDPALVYEPQQLVEHPEDAMFPEPRCITASPSSGSFVVGYADRSLIEFSREHQQWSFRRASLAHVGAVNCIENFPSSSPSLPPGTVITGGNDGTIRFWNFTTDDEEKKEIVNILCPNLLKVIYLEDDSALLLDKKQYEAVGSTDNGQFDKSGVLCTRISHDGRLMVAGTVTGTIFFIDLSFSDMPTLDVVNAHDNEIATLDFSDHATTSKHDYPTFLASGGRDRFVHVFRRIPYSSQFSHCAVLDAHQSAIKSVKFAWNADKLHLYTCSSDKTVLIWKLTGISDERCEFSRIHQLSIPSSICDMNFVKHADILVIAGHDRILRQFDLNGKLIREVKGADDDVAQHGKIVKVTTDSSASYACAVCSDKFVYVTDMRTGTCLAALCGFGAPPTDAVFSEDFRNVMVTTSQGFIFIWRLAKNLTERMVSAQVRLMEEITMRTSSPDSLLGSGSETISDSNSLKRPLGAPEFSGCSTSLCSYQADDDDSTQFSSSVRGSQSKRLNPVNWHQIGSSSFARLGDSSFSPSVQLAPAVERRTHTNIFASPDQYETDASETQSDFVSASSSRRKNRIFSEEEDNEDSASHFGTVGHHTHFLSPPSQEIRRSASPGYQQNSEQLRGYQSSKSMMNLRDVNGGGVRVPTAKELMMSTIAAQRNAGSSSHLSNNNTSSSGRMKWGEMAPVQYNDWQPASSDIHHIQPAMVSSYINQTHEILPHNLLDNPFFAGYPDSTSHPPPVAPRTSSRVLSTPPSQQAIQQIQANSPFRRKSMERNSLSRKFLDNGGTQPKTVWSPQTLSTSSATRRSNSNLFASSMDSNTNLARKSEEPTFSYSLRSRSQSPNKSALSHMLNRDSSPSSTATSSVVNAGSRDRTMHLQQKRRDSDISYFKSANRGRDEMRKSTDALNKLMAVRSKLHQSSENLRKSTENLSLLKQIDDDGNQRTRSITNLRNITKTGTNGAETFGIFDADSRNRSGSTSSLAQSRMLARSVGNVNDELAMEGSARADHDSPSKRLANTIQMMKKASNPDLTAPEQFEDTGSPFALRMRGAVQKKVDRFRPRNKSARNQTSEESDSNNSDMTPLSINKRALAAGNRSTTTSDCSPASSTRSSSIAYGTGGIGSGTLSSRRLYERDRSSGNTTTPKRSANYLVTKMSEKSMEGPDLGSDESPRSSVNSNEWQHLIENSRDGTKNPLVCHVQDCIQQLRINVDKSLQAKKLVEDDMSLPIEKKKIIMCEIERSIEKVVEKLVPNRLNNSERPTVLKKRFEIEKSDEELSSVKVRTYKGYISLKEAQDKVFCNFGYYISEIRQPVPVLRFLNEPTCENIFSEWIRISNEPQPPVPPKNMSAAMIDQYLLYGYTAVQYNYHNDRNSVDGEKPRNWEKISELLTWKPLTLANMAYGVDGLSMYNAMKFISLKGQTGFVVGSMQPWVEVYALLNGASKILTVEYNKLVIQNQFQDRMSSILPIDFAKKWESFADSFDFAASFSSIEHSGIGRYGDPLDPIGDLREMLKIRCMLKKGGHLFLGMPQGTDAIVFNLHRIYGPLRLAMMFAGFDLIHVFDGSHQQPILFDANELHRHGMFAHVQRTLVLRKV
ncbi:unnamed protein product [Caenorhabditis bovis]|uniref:Uncharacterized protein n=1 Tax=Caenorhabditis bovis TaxID=2654633 RepID=A0A8S1E3U4_9PELO|nr:unnamed protein product [Caenorhabditis bovis]